MKSWYARTSEMSSHRIQAPPSCRGRGGGCDGALQEFDGLLPKASEFEPIGRLRSSHDDVQRQLQGQHLQARDLPESALQQVPRDRGLTKSWNDDPNSHVRLRGSSDPDGKVLRPDELPLP